VANQTSGDFGAGHHSSPERRSWQKKAPVQRGVGMNNSYFACTDCKVYVDAGYQWSVWWLEERGVVGRGKSVSADSVLAAKDYWTPFEAESANWLRSEVLPSVRRFLDEHKTHRIVYGNTSDFLGSGSDGLLDWMQVGFLPLLLPRYFVERLGFKTWDEVASFIARQDSTPFWWMLEWDDLHAKVRKKFQDLVELRAARQKTLGCNHIKEPEACVS
jgi:hypothetical protein